MVDRKRIFAACLLLALAPLQAQRVIAPNRNGGIRVGLLKFESLSEDLEALVGRKVDLVTKRGLKPWIRPHVLKEARVTYAA